MITQKHDFSEAERKELAASGAAMPDGSYPIRNATDLHHAISLSGMGGDSKEKIKAHIKARAKALGLEDQLPESWKAAKEESFGLVIKGETADDLQIAYGEVYAPNRPDSDNEYMNAEEIRKMAHKFLEDGRMSQIDIMHDGKVVKGCNVVESFIARSDDPVFIPNAWVVGIHISDKNLWESVKKGDINGFSMEAFVTRHPKEVTLEMPPIIRGLTSKSEDHEHEFYVTYDDEGNFKGGTTSVANGHYHTILAGTHTQETNGHSHRFSSVDGITIVED